MTLIQPTDRFAIFGARGMAGSAISRALGRQGYQDQLLPSRQQLDLLDGGLDSILAQSRAVIEDIGQ